MDTRAPFLALVLLAACQTAPPAADRAPAPDAAPPTPQRNPSHVYPWKGVSSSAAWGRAPRGGISTPSAAGGRPSLSPGTPQAGSLDRALAKRIDGLHLNDQQSLREAMTYLSALVGVNVVVETVAEEAFQDAGHGLNVDLDRSMTLASALDLVAELAGDEVAWTVRDGVVLVTTPDRALGPPRTIVFNVSDLVSGIPSFLPQRIDVAPSGGLVAEDEDLQDPLPIIQEDMLLDLIRNTIDPDGWGVNGNSITIRNGRLIVTHR